MADHQKASFPTMLSERLGLLLDALWEHFPDNMFVIRVDGPRDFILEAVNPAQRVLFDRPYEEIVGKRIDELLPPAGSERVIANYLRCLTCGQPIRYEEHGIYLDPQGVQCEGYWQTLLVPLGGSDGVIRHLFGVSQNVTSLHEAREVLARQNEWLEARVAERTRALKEANHELAELASHDPLTGAANRRHLLAIADDEYRRARRYGHPLAVIMLDVDHFKGLNDEHGHLHGDQILVALAQVLREQARRSDHLARYGGDEFVLLLPETSTDMAVEAAERIRAAAAQRAGCGISVGVAALEARDDDVWATIARADAALRGSKRGGRGRVTVSASS